ncbi:ATP-binding protein [Metallosphaera tengchongensis]|uniref:ATP-binding protein n=1 Tax=Metallosphaera tengchongensis TaxID=1532350 RepID=UPI00157C1518|nr:ATP-binding protein [Metallosphaera tengchongensis]
MEALNRVNPWWFYDNWETKDKHLADWSSQKYRWVPKWIREISLEPFSLNFVYGTRQSGKTTGLKLLIKGAIQGGNSSPMGTYYMDLDFVTSLAEFRRILEGVIKERERRREKRNLLVIDEVTSIDDWWKVLKFFIDRGEFKDDVIVVSGSSTIGLVKTPERSPGRRGKGKEVKVLPLSFPEFVEVTGSKKEDLLYDSAKAQATFEEYKAKGGFPKSINENRDAREALIDGVLSEIYKHGRSPRLVQDILYSLMGKITSALSYNSVASELGISHNTVREYLEFLSDLLVVGIAYLKEGERVVTRREKKVFFRDPFILHSISEWVGREFDESALLENIIQEHLFRKFGEVYFLKDSYEVDVVSGDYRVEVKGRRAHRGYPRGVTIISEEDAPSFLLRLS